MQIGIYRIILEISVVCQPDLQSLVQSEFFFLVKIIYKLGSERKINDFELITEVLPMPSSPLMLSLLVLALDAEAVIEFRKQGSA